MRKREVFEGKESVTVTCHLSHTKEKVCSCYPTKYCTEKITDRKGGSKVMRSQGDKGFSKMAATAKDDATAH